MCVCVVTRASLAQPNNKQITLLSDICKDVYKSACRNDVVSDDGSACRPSTKQLKQVNAATSYSRDGATGRHLPYGITQCYLLPDTSERDAPRPNPQEGTRFTYPGGVEG